jgi:hypothetical protein
MKWELFVKQTKVLKDFRTKEEAAASTLFGIFKVRKPNVNLCTKDNSLYFPI